MNIYVSNLDFTIEDEALRNLFIPYGGVKSAKVSYDKETGRSRGFGFVEMTDDTAVKSAVAELNETIVGGRIVRVVEAIHKIREGSGLNTTSEHGKRDLR